MDRAVRSFVIRGGRMTAAQQRALETLWPRIGIDTGDAPLDLDAAFGRRAPRVLEIGFGNGDLLAASAAKRPDTDFLGIEVHPPGVGRLLLDCEAAAIANVRIIRRDAVEVLARAIAPASLDEVWLYFPDPWPKKRHHKRRIVQASFVALVAERLKPGGLWRLATDWEPYAEEMLALLGASPLLENCAPGGGYLPRPDGRAVTRFERRGTRLGHGVRDLVFRRR